MNLKDLLELESKGISFEIFTGSGYRVIEALEVFKYLSNPSEFRDKDYIDPKQYNKEVTNANSLGKR